MPKEHIRLKMSKQKKLGKDLFWSADEADNRGLVGRRYARVGSRGPKNLEGPQKLNYSQFFLRNIQFSLEEKIFSSLQRKKVKSLWRKIYMQFSWEEYSVLFSGIFSSLARNIQSSIWESCLTGMWPLSQLQRWLMGLQMLFFS